MDDLRHITVVNGRENTLLVKAMQTEDGNHTFSGGTHEGTLPDLDSIVRKMSIAGYEPTRPLDNLASEVANGQPTKLFFKRTTTENPDQTALNNLLLNPDEKQAKKPAVRLQGKLSF